MKYPIAVLVGSMRFTEDFINAQKYLTKSGYIVLTPALYCIEQLKHDCELIKMFREMMYQKIDMADEVFVVNKDGYIGDDTRREIQYSKEHNKKVTYMKGGEINEIW